ncbi:MAG: LysM peptidoglycan-binding domain-containing protein [Chloroflexi bacterium]|nr:LysM peptidoglycan-binding domain-containing protein [Chloroflexota bacterium]
MRRYVLALLLLTLSLAFSVMLVSVDAHPAPAPDLSTAYELIDAVNALRAERGLPAYTPNPILMSIAQTHAEYLAAIGVSNKHTDAYGRLPFQRALDAGYPVAGDLSQNGWFSENLVGGIGLTAEEAVEIWTGDDPHLNTMISTVLKDVGAGVAVVGNTYYYVLDCGLSTGGTPVAYTPPAYVIYPTPILATNTPNEDGSITYTVQPGDTLLGIAIAYDVSLGELYGLNGLTENSVIYTDQQIIIRAAYTATPTQPTSTPTLRPSSTPWPTSLNTAPATEPLPTATQTSVQPSMSAGGAVIAIIVAALVAAGILTVVGAKKSQK